MADEVTRASVLQRRFGRWLFACTLVVYIFTAGGSLTTTDAVVAFDVTSNLVEHGSVAMSGNLLGMEAHRGRDGRYYSPFGIAQSIYNVPFYLAGKAAAATGLHVGKPDTVPKAAVAMGQTLVAAMVAIATFRLAVLVVGNAGAAGWAAITLAFGSLLWPYARFGFNQPLACLALVMAATDAADGMQRGSSKMIAMSGALIGVALLTRHEMAIAAVPMLLWLISAPPTPDQSRAARVRAFVPPMVAATIVWLAFNAWRFGNPFDSGHLRDPIPGFGSPILPGLAALLFSPSASLLLYSPFALGGFAGLAGPLRQRNRPAAIGLGSIVIVFLLFYATLGNWLGGRSYGSRYLLVTLPFLAVGWAALLATLRARAQRVTAIVVLAAGIVVQLPGVIVDYAKVSQAMAAERGAFSTEARQWDWNASGIVMNTRALATAVPDNIDYVSGRRTLPAVREPSTDSDRSFSQQFAFSLDWWWLYLFYLGLLSRISLAAIAIAFLIATLWSVRRMAVALAALSPVHDRTM